MGTSDWFQSCYNCHYSFSTQIGASELEFSHLQEDHDRLMARHSALLQEMAAKELNARQKQDQLIALANQAEKAKQDLEVNAQSQMEALKQTYRVILR